MISAYVTNLGKYNEGDLCGEYLKLPAEKEDVKALLARIGVDGVLYEEFFITDYKTDIDGLCRYMGEYECIDELNYLASMLSELEGWELDKFEAAVALGEHVGCLQELINLAQNLDCYELYPGVNDTEDLGHWLIEEIECHKIPEWMENYFDYEAYGRDHSINEGGEFVSNGYVERNGDSFTEHYKGRHIPDGYRVFAYPDPPDKMPIAKQLKMYARMMAAPVAAEKMAPIREERA